MIQALKAIGDYVFSRREESIFSQIVDNPNHNGKYNTILLIYFIKTDQQFQYNGIKVEEFSENKLLQYAYKKGSPNGSDFTPTSRVTDDYAKTLKRLQRALTEIVESRQKNESEEDDLIRLMHDWMSVEWNLDQIDKDLEAKSFSEGAVLTLVVEQNGKTMYVGDFSIFRENLLGQFEKSLYFRSSFIGSEKESVGYDNICYVCGEKAEKTYGFTSTFAFYTLDKPGFASGGFQRQFAWKNYPVCRECGYKLEIGKKYIQDHLSSRFSGMNYYLIPKMLFSGQTEMMDEYFMILTDLEEKRKMSLQSDTVDRITGAQCDLFSLMQDYDNFINFNILFYDDPGGRSEFRILLYVEDVLPSYMQQLFAAKHHVEAQSIFQQLPGKGEKKFNLTFGFDLFADFFPFSTHAKVLLEILNKVLTARPIDSALLIHRIMEQVRERFRNDEPFWYDFRKALAIIMFLQALHLLRNRKEEQETMVTKNENYLEQFDTFFHQYAAFLDRDEKKAIFLEGVLAQKLINLQKFNRGGATPFRERLNGLKLNERILQRLLPEMQNKLEEYKTNYYVKLEALLSKYLLSSDFSTLSNDEMSFYFTMGMNLADEFIFEKNEEV